MNNFSINGFKRVNKIKAKRLYNEGKAIFIVPCKTVFDFNNMWIQPYELTYNEEMKQRDIDYPSIAFEHTFDCRINNFEFYNCNNELGLYTSFYIKEN